MMQLERIQEIHADIKKLVDEAAGIAKTAVKDMNVSFSEVNLIMDAIKLMEATDYTKGIIEKALL